MKKKYAFKTKIFIPLRGNKSLSNVEMILNALFREFDNGY